MRGALLASCAIIAVALTACSSAGTKVPGSRGPLALSTPTPTVTISPPSARTPDAPPSETPGALPAAGTQTAFEALPADLLCRDLASLGYTYTQSVAYWQMHGRPDRMDADQNGIPCETAYPEAAVRAIYGGVPAQLAPARAALGALPADLLCRDLAGLGYTYADSVVYWEMYGRPARMDDDGNGVPCETVYPLAEVGAIFGSAALQEELTCPTGNVIVQRPSAHEVYWNRQEAQTAANLDFPSPTADQAANYEISSVGGVLSNKTSASIIVWSGPDELVLDAYGNVLAKLYGVVENVAPGPGLPKPNQPTLALGEQRSWGNIVGSYRGPRSSISTYYLDPESISIWWADLAVESRCPHPDVVVQG